MPETSVMSKKGTCWSVTINNPTAYDEECLAVVRQKGWKVDGQVEVGEHGTPHYQLILKTPQVRASAVKRALPRAHIEHARSAQALERYCNKDDTRVAALPQSQEAYPSLSKAWELILEELTIHYGREFTDPRSIPDMFFTLDKFDLYVSRLIDRGFHVETIGVNPQVRSAWKRYSKSLILRAYVSRQARQTTETLVASINIPTHAVQEDGPSQAWSQD